MENAAGATIRVDLHVHSSFSNETTQWILRKMGFQESYTDPLRLYEIARGRGMTQVTITDHNTIEGCLRIAHLPDTFMSEEVTALFPEDGCKVHVLTFDITESQHAEIQRVRDNIYDLVRFLNDEGITHVLAHPLYPVNQRLTLDHVEKLLLLFRNLELNGARSEIPNQTLRFVLSALGQEVMEELADRHGIAPPFPRPWEKTLTGGSDDHSSLNIARTYTEAPGSTVEDLFRALSSGEVRVVANPPSPKTFAHNLYGIGWQHYKKKFALDGAVEKDDLLRWLDTVLRPDPRRGRGLWPAICRLYSARRIGKSRPGWGSVSHGMIFDEAKRTVMGDPSFLSLTTSTADQGEKEQALFRFASSMSNRVLGRMADTVLGESSSFNIFRLFEVMGQSGSLHTALAPYFVAYSLFQQDRAFSRTVMERFLADESQDVHPPCMRIAHFTDTFTDVNGVALTLQQQARMASEKGKPLTVITCDGQRPSILGACRNFQPVSVFSVPEYPGLSLAVPPFMEMLDFCYEMGFTHVHVTSPGPVGLAGLAIAKILGLSCFGTYHTAFPQYAARLTGDTAMEAGMWQYMIWFYGQLDAVFAPSSSTARELVDRGMPGDRVRVYPRGIDTKRFHPSRRNGFFKRYNIHEGKKLLYVGRISKEKNLDLLAESYRKLADRMEGLHLVIVGDGPYRKEMEDFLRGTPAVFTGFLEGEDLPCAYASSDIFVFPSTTDTFGNVVLEAQASGLPVVVTENGGPCENMIPGKTGLVVPGNDPEILALAVSELLMDEKRREEMGAAAYRYMQDRSFDKAFETTWDMYGRIGHVAVC